MHRHTHLLDGVHGAGCAGRLGAFREETEFRTSRCVKRGRSQFLPLVSWEIGIGHSHEARDPIPQLLGGPFEAALGGGLSNCPEE